MIDWSERICDVVSGLWLCYSRTLQKNITKYSRTSVTPIQQIFVLLINYSVICLVNIRQNYLRKKNFLSF